MNTGQSQHPFSTILSSPVVLFCAFSTLRQAARASESAYRPAVGLDVSIGKSALKKAALLSGRRC